MKRIRFLAWPLLALALVGAVFLYFHNRAPTVLFNRVVLEGLTAARDSERLYKMQVPAGARDLQFSVFGGDNGNAIDIYAGFGEPPSTSSFDARNLAGGDARMIAFSAPQAGTWYLLVRGARGAYMDASLVASYSMPGEIFKVGMHAHRLYNGGDSDGAASAEPQFGYGLIRDWDISHLQDAVVWRPDGSIDFSLIDRVYAGHARHGAKVIKTFGTVPTWVSKRPDEPNRQYPNWPGAKSGPRDLDLYEDYVYRFVSHTRKSLWAVEGWNEPYACPDDAEAEFTTMSPTELADVQKRVYRATKRVDPNILVFSPPQGYVCGIPTILDARTSQNEPMSQFFDALAWHAYNRSAQASAGQSYAMEIHRVRQYLAQAGLAQMPIVDTEHGWLPPPKEGGREFRELSDAQKGRVLQETAQLAKSLGLLAIVWYGYDDEFIGMPMKSPVISASLQESYRQLDASQSGAGRTGTAKQ
ncbi:hypothetical protein D3870_21780 [Noviherbaspirillum cavernae]|uniref:Peptidase C-terminal archaeal/bacterial domain-containing protein n=1 Tax=Noviherbaspirillum cavernae TaxID=2320862 RepID=A0A418WW99_9BURK|nr:pre-peptidase C-terminal domain-containing protein [Noviherbaspirillum cavernae]RJF96986.1 hypothetical protein D3870_21780 [Noviherbaspirillum cavernae]